jgi:hypothetical protein
MLPFSERMIPLPGWPPQSSQHHTCTMGCGCLFSPLHRRCGECEGSRDVEATIEAMHLGHGPLDWSIVPGSVHLQLLTLWPQVSNEPICCAPCRPFPLSLRCCQANQPAVVLGCVQSRMRCRQDSRKPWAEHLHLEAKLPWGFTCVSVTLNYLRFLGPAWASPEVAQGEWASPGRKP